MSNCSTVLQMFPIAVTCGNTFVLKPCENNPGDFESVTIMFKIGTFCFYLDCMLLLYVN